LVLGRGGPLVARSFGPQRLNAKQRPSEHLFVEKEQRRKCLILGPGRHSAAQSQISQESLSFLFRGKIGSNAFAEIIVSGNPSTIGILCAQSEMHESDFGSHHTYNLVA
jgi:hypothetical protein